MITLANNKEWFPSILGDRGSSEADFDGGFLRQYRLGNFGGIFLAASQWRVDLTIGTHDIPHLQRGTYQISSYIYMHCDSMTESTLYFTCPFYTIGKVNPTTESGASVLIAAGS